MTVDSTRGQHQAVQELQTGNKHSGTILEGNPNRQRKHITIDTLHYVAAGLPYNMLLLCFIQFEVPEQPGVAYVRSGKAFSRSVKYPYHIQ